MDPVLHTFCRQFGNSTRRLYDAQMDFVISTAVNAIVVCVFGIGDLPAEHPPRHADGCGGADRLWHRPGVWTRAAGARPVPVDARVR